MQYLHSDIKEKIINAFYNVYNKLGYGFFEKVFENAMCIELQKMGITIVNQLPIEVIYDNQIVGNYFADIIVNNLVIVELKAAENICEEHEYQLIN